jgi:hypothetical protein
LRVVEQGALVLLVLGEGKGREGKGREEGRKEALGERELWCRV